MQHLIHPTLIEPETERLYLRAWQEGHRESLAALLADAKVREFYPSRLSRAESDSVFERWQTFMQDYGWGVWAVELKTTGAFAGFVGLQIPRVTLPCSPCVEVMWSLHTAYWQQGIATEAARASLKVGFEQLQLEEIVAFAVLANQRSQAVMQRLGMQVDGSFEHPQIPADSPLREHYLYRLSRQQYQSSRLAELDSHSKAASRL